MPDQSKLEIREYRPGDEAGIIACFNAVFSPGNPAFEPRELDFWRWEFERNPAGWRIFVALEESGRIIAQYAALPCRVWLKERQVFFNQIVDSMSHPDYRRALGGKKSLFVRTAEPFFDTYGAPDKDVVMFGFPIPIAWRIGKTYLQYEMVREVNLLARPSSTSAPGPPMPSGWEVVTTNRVDTWIERLWLPFRDSVVCATVRDAAYLNWRFADKPGFEYCFAIAREQGCSDARGMLVYRRGDFVLPECALLADWMVPAGDHDAAQALLHWYDARTRSDGLAQAVGVLPTTSPWFLYFQEYGFRVVPTSYFMVARNFVKRFDMRWLRENWFYTLGDTDLV